MRHTFIKWTAVFLMAGWTGSLMAMPTSVTPDGVWGLDVGGVLYDIAIGDMGGDTVDTVYANYGLTAIPDPTLVAINESLRALFNNPPSPHTPGVPLSQSFFNGCTAGAGNCLVLLPTFLTTGGAFAGNNLPVFAGGSWLATFSNLIPGASAGNLPSVTYGVVTAKAPLPGTLALFWLGLAGLGISRRKRSQHS